MSFPSHVIVLSGKRKSGKDFLANKILERLGQDVCEILHLSGPLKQQYAQEHGLDYEELLKSSAYKETYRADMIVWGEDKRKAEPYFFCDKTVESADPERRVWVVADARRPTDVQYFRERFKDRVLFMRVTANESVRKDRGFVFTPGVDDAESECALDHVTDWNLILQNDGEEDIEKGLKAVIDAVSCKLQRVT